MGTDAKKWLSVRDLVDALGVSRQTIARMAQRGQLPCYRCGDRMLFPPDILERLAADAEANARQREDDTITVNPPHDGAERQDLWRLR